MDIQIYSDSAGRVPLAQWLEALTDRQGRAAIKARLLRLEAGNFGDCKPLRDGVQELRIEPPWVLRRLLFLRGLSHEQEVEPVFT